MKFKKLTLLHNNDIHGDFFAKEDNEALLGGLSLLSGYVQKVRREEENVIYAIAGDMLQGSIIDQEYRGVSTIDVMNLLGPDIVTLGNHEIDYGLAHLMFLERCAHFPIINANLHIRPTNTRLFKSHQVMMVGGIRILFIGLITEDILSYAGRDPLLGSFVDVREAAREVEYICNNYKDVDIDFTVLLTHIGFDKDVELAGLLPEEIGVDLILGGHSHTMMDQPAKVKDILIAQVGTGSTHIGRFDIIINMDTNSIHEFTWEAIPIDDSHCPRDYVLDEVLENYSREVDIKYNSLISRLKRPLEHPSRYVETELGNLFADMFRNQLDVDLFILGSGSIRGTRMEEIVTLSKLREIFPYDEAIMSFTVDGQELKNMLGTFFKKVYAGETHEFYQYSQNVSVRVEGHGEVQEVLFSGQPLKKEDKYKIAMQMFHYGILEETFGINIERIKTNGPIRCVSTSSFDIIDEYLQNHHFLSAQQEGRILLEIPLHFD
ncbi:MAG: bifunctional metallophosphatase/5'-nucleotidase [Tissierellia bacterium]|nr:bifunctional metallophosphatase/5'-nucleotidase [Tissierellia bacterium]